MKIAYLLKFQSSVRHNSKYFRKFINGQRGNNSLPKIWSLGLISADIGQDIVDLFAQSFKTNYSTFMYHILSISEDPKQQQHVSFKFLKVY